LGKLEWYDWIILFTLIALAFIPDPSDAVDLGLPIAEPLMAYIYYYWVSKKRK